MGERLAALRAAPGSLIFIATDMRFPPVRNVPFRIRCRNCRFARDNGAAALRVLPCLDDLQRSCGSLRVGCFPSSSLNTSIFPHNCRSSEEVAIMGENG